MNTTTSTPAAAHTPGPWVTYGHAASDGHILTCEIRGAADEFIGDVGSLACSADASRIVACVNACEGMDFPASQIETLRVTRDAFLAERDRLAALNKTLVEALREAAAELDYFAKAYDHAEKTRDVCRAAAARGQS